MKIALTNPEELTLNQRGNIIHNILEYKESLYLRSIAKMELKKLLIKIGLFKTGENK